MSNQVIPARVLERAKEIGRGQGYLPPSPYSLEPRAKVALCAAACLAYAGFEAISEPAAERFVRSLVTDAHDTALYEAFEQLNWPRALCESVRIENDNTPPDLRLPTFVATCTALQAGA